MVPGVVDHDENRRVGNPIVERLQVGQPVAGPRAGAPAAPAGLPGEYEQYRGVALRAGRGMCRSRAGPRASNRCLRAAPGLSGKTLEQGRWGVVINDIVGVAAEHSRHALCDRIFFSHHSRGHAARGSLRACTGIGRRASHLRLLRLHSGTTGMVTGCKPSVNLM